MKIFANTFYFTTAGALVAITMLPLMLVQAKASTTERLLECQGNSRQKVTDCCQKILRKEQRPFWLSSGSGSCSGAVVCTGGASTGKKTIITAYVKPKLPKCVLVIPETPGKDGGPDDTPPPVKDEGGKD